MVSALYLFGATCACAAPAQGAVPALASAVVATVNGVNITKAQLDAALHATGLPDNAQTRQALKKDLIAQEVLRQNAEQGNYGNKPQVLEAMSQAKTRAEIDLYVQEHIHPEPISDAQVREKYNALIASLGKEEYKLSVISVRDKGSALEIVRDVQSGQDFGTLAQERSIAPSKLRGGALSWLSFKMPPQAGKTQGLALQVAQALTTLRVGDITKEPIVVSDANGTSYVIVKLDAKRPTQVPAFESSKETLRQQMEAIARKTVSAELIQSLIKNARITQ